MSNSSKLVVSLFVINGLAIGISVFCVSMGWMEARKPDLDHVIWAITYFCLGYSCHKYLHADVKPAKTVDPLDLPGRW